MSTNAINIQLLPLEVLQYIFILSGNPHFPLVSQNFYKAANSQTSVKTQWLLCKFEGDCKKALHRGIKWKFFNKEILNQLDNLYHQQNPGCDVIPCENRSLPQWFFRKENDQMLELTKIFLDRKVSPDMMNGYPIVQSARIGNIKMAKLLIHYGAKVEMLALYVSVDRGNLEMVTLLLKHGCVQPDSKALEIAADRRAKNENLDKKAADNFGKIFELLKNYGAVENLRVVNAFGDDNNNDAGGHGRKSLILNTSSFYR
ncbi:9547_t:CDS:2 [Acaulospora colombiana]|uniref:9547_t:CDS:1 n=1 Tax=Acaulospora colombiana TaxID=27376 RepID=A0ACA9LGK2_9GLOM|nr:9547_t:CDS:2 [Acaulospora colombiana]